MNQNIKKEDCLDCKDLPEGEVVQGHDHRVTNLRYKKLNLEAKLIDIDLSKTSRYIIQYKYNPNCYC
jgi:hypothetical protein